MPKFPRLTVDKVKKLINRVKKRPCLWDREHGNFNKIFNTGMAWKSIAAHLDISEITAKSKWRNLRDIFNRIITKNPEYLYHYEGDWPFFHDLAFLITTPRLKKVQRSSPTTESMTEYLEIYEEEAKDESTEVTEHLPHSDDYYDLLFLESLAPYFKSLDPVRRASMRVKIQDMLMSEIADQQGEV